MPALTAATNFLIGGASSFFSFANFSARDRNGQARAVIAAVSRSTVGLPTHRNQTTLCAAEFFKVDNRAQRSSDQSLNFCAAAIEPAFHDVARFTRRR